jgi:hypothetical protein
MSRNVRLRVKELAQQQGLSEWDLVAGSGLDVRVVRRMIANQGVRQMLVSQLARIGEALNVPTASLFVEPGMLEMAIQPDTKQEKCEVCEKTDGPFIRVEVSNDGDEYKWLLACGDNCLHQIALRWKQIGEIIRP